MPKRIGFLACVLGVLFYCWPVSAISYLLPKELVVSTNVFVIQNALIGLNTSTPLSLLDIRNYPQNTRLMTLTTAGNLGIQSSSPTEKLDVSGNIKLSSNGGLSYHDAAYGVVYPDWKLVTRDDCNTYRDGVSSGWYNSSDASYTTVTTFNGYKILG